MRGIPLLILSCVVVTLGLIGIQRLSQQDPVEDLSIGDSVVHDVDSVIDSAVLGHTSESSELARKEPHIVTALDVVNKPHYSRDISLWAKLRAQREIEAAGTQPSKNIASLKAEQRALEAKLHSMMKHRVRSTAAGVDKVLAVQARLAASNKAEIRKELTTDAINTHSAPAFHSAALDGPVHVVSGESEISKLESELARKVAASQRLGMRKQHSHVKKVVKVAKAVAPKVAAVAPVKSVVVEQSIPTSSLAEEPASVAAEAGDYAASDDDKDWAWESPKHADSVPYEGMRDDAMPAARDALGTARHRVTARLETQLRNAKQRLERFRSHWSVYMPEDLHRATHEGWTSQYARDYLSQGKTRADLSTEEEIIHSLSADMESAYQQKADTSEKLRDVQEEQHRLSAEVSDLSRQISQDQRDLSVAHRNAEALRRHLPEYYDDLSDTDYESYHPHPRQH